MGAAPIAVEPAEPAGRGRAWWLGAAVALARHPSLWPTALGQVRRLAPRGWWRRPPFVPVPDPAYLRFRLVTMYGDAGHALEPADLVTYLRWCRDFPAPHRHRLGPAAGAGAPRPRSRVRR